MAITLDGGTVNDACLYNLGDGQDVIQEVNSWPDAWATDVLRLGAEIHHDQLWFSQVGDNLSIQVIGTTDQAA